MVSIYNFNIMVRRYICENNILIPVTCTWGVYGILGRLYLREGMPGLVENDLAQNKFAHLTKLDMYNHVTGTYTFYMMGSDAILFRRSDWPV